MIQLVVARAPIPSTESSAPSIPTTQPSVTTDNTTPPVKLTPEEIQIQPSDEKTTDFKGATPPVSPTMTTVPSPKSSQ